MFRRGQNVFQSLYIQNGFNFGSIDMFYISSDAEFNYLSPRMLGFALRGQIAEILQEYVFEMPIAVYRARDRHLETRPELVQPLKTKWDVLQ